MTTTSSRFGYKFNLSAPLLLQLEPAATAATSLNFMNSAYYSARCSSSDPHERRRRQLCRYRARLALQRSRIHTQTNARPREIRGRKRNSTAAGLYQYNRKSICSAFYISWNCCCCCHGFARFLRIYSDDLHLDADSRHIKFEPRKAAIKQRPARNRRSLRKIFRSRLAATRSMENRLIDFLIPARIEPAQRCIPRAQLGSHKYPKFICAYVFSALRFGSTGGIYIHILLQQQVLRRRHWYVLKQRNNDFSLSLSLSLSLTPLAGVDMHDRAAVMPQPTRGDFAEGVTTTTTTTSASISCFSRKCLGNRSSCSAAALPACTFSLSSASTKRTSRTLYVYSTTTRATFCTRRERASRQ
uniref:Uncharacterized protein n=1 Tax=Trichogramma kaykai TaxID=54128 RepID=A0ABD2X283_9HYME